MTETSYAADVAAGVLESHGIQFPKSSEMATSIINGLVQADAAVGTCGAEAALCVCALTTNHRAGGHVCGDCGSWPSGAQAVVDDAHRVSAESDDFQGRGELMLDNKENIEQLAQWTIDQGTPEWAQILKVCEEAGEAAQAYLRHAKQTPSSDPWSGQDVVNELADTAIAALVAIQRLGWDGEQVLQTRLGAMRQRFLAGEVDRPQ